MNIIQTVQTLILKTTGRRVLNIAAIGKIRVHAGKHGIRCYLDPANQTFPLGTVVVLCIYIAPHNVECAVSIELIFLRFSKIYFTTSHQYLVILGL